MEIITNSKGFEIRPLFFSENRVGLEFLAIYMYDLKKNSIIARISQKMKRSLLY